MQVYNKLVGYLLSRDRAWVLSLFITVCLLYLPYLGSPFVFDDTNFFSGDIPEHYAHAGFDFSPRWLPFASLGWTYRIFDDIQTDFYRLGNLLLHAASVISLFYLARKLIGAVLPEQQDSSALVQGAWLAALIFAVHPVAVYAAGYVIQRSILMATLFVLLMQLAYLQGLLTGRHRWLFLAAGAYFLAVFSKEHSVLSPALLVGETLLLNSRRKASSVALSITWVAFAAIAILIALSVKGIVGTPYEADAHAMFNQEHVATSVAMQHLLSVLTQAGLFFKYLGMWLVPNPMWMSLDMREQFDPSIGQWQYWVGAVCFVLYGVIALKLLLKGKQAGLIGFALLYPWLQFILEFSTIRVQEVFVLYRSYLWMPGLLLIIPLFVLKWPGRRMVLILCLVVLLLVPLALNRLWVFADEFRLWNDAAKLLRTGDEPLASRIYYNRGVAEGKLGKWNLAAEDYEKAIAKNPKEDPIMIHDLGVAYFNTHRYKEALAEIDRAIALDPTYAKAYYDKGMTLKWLGQPDQAMQQMETSCKMKYFIACVIVEVNPDRKR